ncbi:MULTISPECIES: tyrosinase family protein [Rhodobacterales]|uniref:tyrosinase family protein n=2 Tax=Rhodobacterales TaxID=204455 RepID=UPI00351856E8
MTMTRRRALSLGSAGLFATTVPLATWMHEARAEYMRTRYDAASPEGKEMLGIYASAVGQMKTRDPSDPTSWQFQFFTHWMDEQKAAAIDRIYGPDASPEKMAAEAMWNTCRGHITWASQADFFVPWHRMYVLYLEKIVRQVSGEDDFTLPYWNYTDPASLAIPEEFRDPASPLFVADRNPGINDGTAVMNGLSLAFMSRTAYLGQIGFNRTLDNNPHGAVHVMVGTTTNMGNVPTAANDPVFWVHHAQIDRCWASWNAAGNANPTDTAWTDQEFQFYDPVENQLVSVPSGRVTTTEELGYGYQDLIPAPAPLTAMVERDKLIESAPMVLAAAEDVPLTASVDTGPVKLGAEPVTARVAAPEQSLALGGPSDTRLYLVIGSLATEIQPGVVYDVYLGGPEVAREQREEWLVGQIHFFNATASVEEAEKSDAVFAFDVTDHMAVLTAEATDGLPAPQVTFAPAGTPAEDAEPLVGDIRFVEE